MMARLALAASSLLLLIALPAHAQSSADCLACHCDASMTMERAGKQVSIAVKESVLKASAHSKLACVSCHRGFDPSNIPHTAKIEPIVCSSCHKEAGVKHPFHPQIAQALKAGKDPDISCKDCHGEHQIFKHDDPRSKVAAQNLSSQTCNPCHSSMALSSKYGLASDRFKTFTTATTASPSRVGLSPLPTAPAATAPTASAAPATRPP